MSNEEIVCKKWNSMQTTFKAWPVGPIPGLKTSFVKPWLLLVRPPRQNDDTPFPSPSDRFHINMEAVVELGGNKFSLQHLPATRISNPYESLESLEGSQIQRCAAFQVDVPRSWETSDDERHELDLMARFQVAPAINDVEKINLCNGTHQKITIQWDSSSATFEAELSALRHLIEPKRNKMRGPSVKSVKVFKMIQDFNAGWKDFYNLHEDYPHLRNPEHPFHRVPGEIVDRYKSFNDDHKAAFDGLSRIPNALYFVNGCPGSGKTEWNLVVSALVQSKRRPGSRRRHSPILFLVDINKTVDDAAHRYYNMCKSAGLKLRIIRMHGFPYEMRHSVELNKTAPSPGDEEIGLDFTRRFLTTAGISQHGNFERSQNKAPTLDEAAWDYYKLHKNDCFSSLKKILDRMDEGQVLESSDWKGLRGFVALLYRAVIAQADFIATTPVAASGSFPHLFHPDIIFVDEAPHARELTTMIPIAYFEPLAWIFTGDVKQTRPFVKTKTKRDAEKGGLKWNPFAEQLRVSTMARAARVNAISSQLLVNTRAYGNLHLLPSKLFYHGNMVSGRQGTALYPQSTLHLKKFLEMLGNCEHIDENRVIVCLRQSEEVKHGSSFLNPVHHNWLLQHVQKLLRDADFRSITEAMAPGTIMIQTPYRAAMLLYSAEIKRWPKDWQSRVQVVTVDKAQGNQADVVFLDMVRTTSAGFMDDPQRLNVSISRARQAEVIIMHFNMTRRAGVGRFTPSQYTSQVWDDAAAQGRLFML